MVFTGKADYTRRKLRELHGRGWAIVRSHAHPDGTTTYVLTYVGSK